MKYSFTIGLVLIAICASSIWCNETLKSSSATLQFDKKVIHCDTLDEGIPHLFVFPFTNTGSDTLVICNVKTSCGCLVAQWPKKPILPGARDSIKAIYSTLMRPGPFTKSITVKSNDSADPTQFLYCKGYTRSKISER